MNMFLVIVVDYMDCVVEEIRCSNSFEANEIANEKAKLPDVKICEILAHEIYIDRDGCVPSCLV